MTAISEADVLAALLGQEAPGSDIVRQLRLPRALAGFACGGLLALAGALMQVLWPTPIDVQRFGDAATVNPPDDLAHQVALAHGVVPRLPARLPPRRLRGQERRDLVPVVEVGALEAGEVVEKGDAARIFSSPERERTQRFIATLTESARSVPQTEKGAG